MDNEKDQRMSFESKGCAESDRRVKKAAIIRKKSVMERVVTEVLVELVGRKGEKIGSDLQRLE